MDSRRRTVQRGYDRLADRYAEWAGRVPDDPRSEMVARFSAMLVRGARVLDIGSGSGLPSTAELAGRFEVTGVDISAAQVAAAGRNVPGAHFIQGDILEVELPPASFEGVIALYSISHLPRSEHARLLARIHRWLVPGGVLLATLGADDGPDWTGEWLGVPMFFSAYDADVNRRLLRDAGFELIVDEVCETLEPEGAVPFLWVIARRGPAARGEAPPSSSSGVC